MAVAGLTWDVVVLAQDARLVSFDGERLLAVRHGAKVHLDDVTFAVGGGAANVAVVASRFGLRTIVVSRVGTGRSAG